MSIETKYVCDVCGAVRGEANHWFILGLNDGEESSSIAVWPFDIDELYEGQRHVCGQKCAHALLDRWLTTGGLTPIEAPQ